MLIEGPAIAAADFSPRTSGFNPRAIHVRFLVARVELAQFFSVNFGVSLTVVVISHSSVVWGI